MLTMLFTDTYAPLDWKRGADVVWSRCMLKRAAQPEPELTLRHEEGDRMRITKALITSKSN